MIKKDINKKNIRYHGPLINTGVRLGYFKIYPWINLAFSIFAYFSGGYEDKLGIIKGIYLICIAINLVAIFVSFFKGLINNFKSCSYILLALVILTTLMWLDFIGLMMFISDGSPINADSFYNSGQTLFFVIFMSILFIGSCLFYAWFYFPKNQGKVWKFNQSLLKDNKLFDDNFWFVLLGILVIPSVFTGYLQNILGIILGSFLTLILPAVIVDAIYASLYIRKYPDEDKL